MLLSRLCRFLVVALLTVSPLAAATSAHARVMPYEEHIQEAASWYSLDPALLKAVILAESWYNSQAVSSKGAKGLTQLMPGTAREMGVRNPFSPRENIFGGARYLRMQILAYQDISLALAAYNAGPGRVRDRVPNIPETTKYVRKVLYYYNYFRSVEGRGY